MAYPALPDLLSLEEKRALITGAAFAIGRAIAPWFAEDGASLELIDRGEEGLWRPHGTLRESQMEVHTHRVDLSRKEEIEAMGARRKGHSAEMLMDSLGVYTFRPFEETDETFYDGALAVNPGRCLLDAPGARPRFAPRARRRHCERQLSGSLLALRRGARSLRRRPNGRVGPDARHRQGVRPRGDLGQRPDSRGIRTEGVRCMQRETLRRRNIRRMILALHFSARLPVAGWGIQMEWPKPPFSGPAPSIARSFRWTAAGFQVGCHLRSRRRPCPTGFWPSKA
jgi:hypothetical protein